MRRWALLLILLLATVQCCSAGGITLSTDQKDYYFVTGEEAVIEVGVENTCGCDVPGMLTRYTSASGPTHVIKRSQAQTCTIFSDMQNLKVRAGTSDTPAVIQIGLGFEYTDSETHTVSLREIAVHFVTDPSEKENKAEEQVSSETTGESESSSGGDGEAGKGDGSGLSGAEQAVQNSQMAEDSDALKKQLEEASAIKNTQKQELLERIFADPLFGSVNESLNKQGFMRSDEVVTPGSNGAGSFSFAYERAGEEAMLRGDLNESALLYAEQSSDALLELPEPLLQNQTFCEYEQRMDEEAMLRTNTLINTSPQQTEIRLGYGRGGQAISSVDARIENGTLTEINLHENTPATDWLLPLLGVLLCLLLGGYVVSHIKRPESLEVSEVSEPPYDHRKAASVILQEARDAFEAGDRTGGYAEAGRALRLFVSYEYGNGTEMTNREVSGLALPEETAGVVQKTLRRSAEVAFAKGLPEAREFSELAADIGAVIG